MDVEEPDAEGWRTVTIEVPPRKLTVGAGYQAMDDGEALDTAAQAAAEHAKRWNRDNPTSWSMTCEECGTVFRTMRGHARFCSTKCRMRAHRAAAL